MIQPGQLFNTFCGSPLFVPPELILKVIFLFSLNCPSFDLISVITSKPIMALLLIFGPWVLCCSRWWQAISPSGRVKRACKVSSYSVKNVVWFFWLFPLFLRFIEKSGEWKVCSSKEHISRYLRFVIFQKQSVLFNRQIPDCADLIQRMLTVDPHSRITIDEIRHHPWVTEGKTH